MNWWTNKGTCPPGAEDALRNAGDVYRPRPFARLRSCPHCDRGEGAREQERRRDEYSVGRSKCDRWGHGAVRPVIDGRPSAMPRGPTRAHSSRFVPLAKSSTPVQVQNGGEAALRRRGAYTSRFVALNPTWPGSKSTVDVSDSMSIFGDDVVELFVAAAEKTPTLPAFGDQSEGYHVGPPRKRSRRTGTTSDPFSGPWQHAVRLGEGAWTVEVAIPWSSLGLTTALPGLKLRANLGRERAQGGELSTWRTALDKFVDPESFGAWLFL